MKTLLLIILLAFSASVKGQETLRLDSLERKIDHIQLHLARSQGYYRTAAGLTLAGATLIVLGAINLDHQQVKDPNFYRGMVLLGSSLVLSGGVVLTLSHKEIGIAGNWKTKEVRR